jgi:hypothetical protein
MRIDIELPHEAKFDACFLWATLTLNAGDDLQTQIPGPDRIS